MAQRHQLDTGKFYDVSFEAICRDPMAVVRSIYDFFGLGLGEEAQSLWRVFTLVQCQTVK